MRYKTRFFLFFAGMILFNLAANFAHPVTPTIIQELQLPDYMFGLMFAAMMLTNFLFSPFWGKINTAISSRQTLLTGCVGYAVAQLGFAYATTQAGILAVRILAGFFVGGIYVSFLTYVINVAKPEDQAKFLTYSATVQAVFGAFGYLVGGILGEFSIRGTFLLQAACLAFAGLVFRLACLPDNTVSEKIPMGRILRQSNPMQAFLDGRHFMNLGFAMLFALNVLMNFGNTGFDQVFNYYLKDQLGLTSAYNGVIKAAVGFISFAANMTLCLWIIRKTDTRKSMAAVTVFCTAAAIGALIFPQTGRFILCGVLLYAGYSVSLPVLQHMAAVQADPAQKNLVMGFYNATKSLGSILGSLMAGFLYGIHIRLPFLVVAVTYGLSILAAAGYLLWGKGKKAEHSAE
ncbi:MAG: MFS transporter [Oscillospiraceae bacterium]|nr:MFS transporter [Oscillospiraceae bacterium]